MRVAGFFMLVAALFVGISSVATAPSATAAITEASMVGPVGRAAAPGSAVARSNRVVGQHHRAQARLVLSARQATTDPPSGCTPPMWVPMLTNWQVNVFKVSFCSSWFWLNNTRTGQTWSEGMSGWFCQHAPAWAIWAVTRGKYRRC